MDQGMLFQALKPYILANNCNRALSETWEMKANPVGSKYPNALSQISIFVLLDVLGSINPTIPSYFLLTHWAYKNMARLEGRLRKIGLLETSPLSAFLPMTNKPIMESEIVGDYVPFMERGIPFIRLLPSPLPPIANTIEDNGEHLHLPTVRDWAKIVTGFALEWLDMMEVWPE
jgi:glutaminyl-peptide cyclotransferase